MKITLLFLLFVSMCLELQAQKENTDWKAKAIQKYPELGVEDSVLRKKFIELYTVRRKTSPAFFKDPKWFLTLADEASRADETAEAKKAREIGELMEEAKLDVRGKIIRMADDGAIMFVSGMENPVWVFGLSDKVYVDGDPWSGTLWITPVHTVTNSSGAKVRFRAFSTTKEDALKRFQSSAQEDGSATVENGKATGTGFAVGEDGYIATAFHVVRDAKSVKVVIEGREWEAVVVGKDQSNDLAILKVDAPTRSTLTLARSADQKVGDEVFTTGFPDPQVQGENVKLTRGNINAASGMQDNTTMFQISVGVHGGNSGGPLVNRKGEVVGLITSKLGLKYMKASQELPQNVNYAVKADYLSLLLDTIPNFVRPGGAGANVVTPEEAAQKATYLVRVRL
jgi:hypothetical protein